MPNNFNDDFLISQEINYSRYVKFSVFLTQVINNENIIDDDLFLSLI